MKFHIEHTENPSIIKFSTNEIILSGNREFNTPADAADSPLASELLQFPFVESIYMTSNFVALKKSDTVEWEMVLEELKAIVEKHSENDTILNVPKKKEPYSLYAEMTPNPSSMKFVSNRGLVPAIVEVKTQEDAKEVPIAEMLYKEFSFIKEVFISENYFSLIANEGVEWADEAMAVRQNLLNYLQSGLPIFTDNYVPKSHPESVQEQREFTDIENKIKDILEEYIKPAVAGDGGNIDLIKFEEENKTAHMLLQGSCSGCPSSTITLKNGIQTMLQNMMPGVVDNVEAVNG